MKTILHKSMNFSVFEPIYWHKRKFGISKVKAIFKIFISIVFIQKLAVDPLWTLSKSIGPKNIELQDRPNNS